MQHKDLGVINPTSMQEQQSKTLGAWLNKYPQLNLIRKNRPYALQTPPAGTPCQFTLSHHLLRRERKPGKNGIRYEVISKELGKGNNGIVYLSVGTITIQNGRAVFKNKNRAAKECFSHEEAKIEYEFTSKAPGMHVKPLTDAPSLAAPQIKSSSSYLVEKYFTGSNLYEIIETEMPSKLLLTVDERIQLSLNILLAVEELHASNLIHRDIKPENIMVDNTTRSAALIDFRYAKNMNDPQAKEDSAGTVVTMPPEQFAAYPKDKQIYTAKSDCYAVGKTLAELWNAVAEVNANEKAGMLTFFKYSLKDTKYDYSESYMSGLSEQHADKIKQMLEQLTRSAPENRWTIAQAVALLKEVQQERNHPMNNNKKLPSKR